MGNVGQSMSAQPLLPIGDNGVGESENEVGAKFEIIASDTTERRSMAGKLPSPPLFPATFIFGRGGGRVSVAHISRQNGRALL